MRVSLWMLTTVLVAALVGCDGGGEEDPGTGGTGGTGGSGGTGGVEKSACDGLRVIEAESGTNVVVQDRTDTVDNWVGSCTMEDVPGNDVVVHFVFPEAGHYHFSTAGSETDTLVYALEDCMNGFTELRCNDTYFDEFGAFTLLDREAGDDIYVVVDSVNDRQSKPFTLTITKVPEPVAPVVETFDAYFNPTSKAVGVRLTGKAADAPLVAYGLQVYGSMGEPLADEPIVIAFGDPNLPLLAVAYQDRNFLVEGSFSLGDPPVVIGAVELTLIDANELQSAWDKKNTVAPPTLARGEPCHPSGALGVCEGTDVCRSPVAGEPPVCSPAS
jgi:hypothetical protein